MMTDAAQSRIVDPANMKTIDTMLAHFGGGKALAMIGGTASYSLQELAIYITFLGKARDKINRLVIRYDRGYDTYEVDFWAGRGANAKRIDTITNVYCDALRSIVEERINLRLSL